MEPRFDDRNMLSLFQSHDKLFVLDCYYSNRLCLFIDCLQTAAYPVLFFVLFQPGSDDRNVLSLFRYHSDNSVQAGVATVGR